MITWMEVSISISSWFMHNRLPVVWFIAVSCIVGLLSRSQSRRPLFQLVFSLIAKVMVNILTTLMVICWLIAYLLGGFRSPF